MRKKDNIAATIFIAPSLIGFLVFFGVPFLISIYYSLMSSPVGGDFVGLANYMELLGNPVFGRACVNMLTFTLMSVPAIMLISLFLAIVLNKELYFRNLFRTFFISPLIIPVASVVLVWQIIFMYNGSLNGILGGFGIGPVDWMNSEWARFVVVIIYIWKNVGYNMVIFLAGLQNIPEQYYEPAELDGASSFKRFTGITMVYLTPTLFFVFIISIINSFKVFKETYLIAGSYPQEDIYTIQHYMNNMFVSLDYQKLTSAAFIMAVMIFILVMLLFFFERKISQTIE